MALECDASATGLGTALFQENQIVGYASRTLNNTKRGFAKVEKECLAIVFGCTRFDQFLADNSLITDALSLSLSLSRAPEELKMKEEEIWGKCNVFELAEEVDVTQELDLWTQNQENIYKSLKTD